MATAKTILRKTHGEAIVKVAGTDSAQTISLANDLLPAAGQVLDGAVQTVNIVGITWTGAAGSSITVSRNGVTIMTLLGETATQMEFGGQMMIPDTIQNDKDIVVTIAGAQAECWIRLRKVGGYKTTIEPEQYGSHDNPAAAGS